MNHYIYVIYQVSFTSLLCIFHFIILLLIKCLLKIYKHNGFDLFIPWYDDENNNDLLFYHNFCDKNVKFYHSTRLQIYIILKNNYVYVDIMIIKYSFNICWNN
jgi:hypothetical protein